MKSTLRGTHKGSILHYKVSNCKDVLASKEALCNHTSLTNPFHNQKWALSLNFSEEEHQISQELMWSKYYMMYGLNLPINLPGNHDPCFAIKLPILVNCVSQVKPIVGFNVI